MRKLWWLRLLLISAAAAGWLLRGQLPRSPVPAVEAAQIRQAMLDDLVASHYVFTERRFRTMLVVTPTRQVFRVPDAHLVALTAAEVDGYVKQHPGGLVRLDLIELEIAPGGRRAVLSYGLYESQFVASGATFEFVKREGKWFKGRLVSAWTS